MTIEINDLDINVIIKGTGTPFVMLHGFELDYRSMEGALEPILDGRDYKRIYFDLPGMGESECSDKIQNADDMLEIVVKLIKELIPEEKFVVAGLSYGGYLARGLAKLMPESILGMLLFCPVIYPRHAQRILPEHKIVVEDLEFLESLNEEDREEFESFNSVLTENVYDRIHREIIVGTKMGDPIFRENYQSRGYGFKEDVDQVDSPYYFPSLVLVGKQDFIVGYKDAVKLMDLYSSLTYVALESAGHSLHIEQEELFNLHVRVWLRRINALL
ncbi:MULTISPECIES: alpha/beta fold hydrolase [unclassified Fusibacter]|uniref:alpha/beta fold hydrolase n=1 Tax=unclassified Fusibacter TaxID=2624464 RepID=UPI00101360F0|nr:MULTISPECIES: alpha/beta hydrolase [unclassified Fusibacter]MCK8058978.1 alpha/beta hydrolase [Fusibacter sp. A2]NPE22389.1 alpha/beta hydrolase [Fusibacter sp. A1]RXV60495.1 alpha/beta hydrolase [Fusibacter sp. A1]